MKDKSLVLWAFAILCLFPFVTSATALVTGLILSLGLGLTLDPTQKKTSKLVMQISIVLMGFGMDPSAVVRAGGHGVGVTAFSIVFTIVAGFGLAKLLGVAQKISILITMGSAICGASAIAAVSPVIKAENEEIAVGLAVVFTLNSVALLFFPELGHFLGMSVTDFGYFAAIAIHDTSSVVGAAARFSEASLSTATTIKLTRALWILPITVVLGLWMGRKSEGKKPSFLSAVKAGLPWFIPAFVAVVALKAMVPADNSSAKELFAILNRLGRSGMTMAIFLIGAQMSRAALKKAGARPLWMGVLLWITIIVMTATLIRAGQFT